MPNLDMNDLMAIRGIDRENDRCYGHGGNCGNYGYGSMTPYEQMKVSYMQAKRPSGVAIAGLTVGAVGVVAGIGAWIFGGAYANAKSREAAQIGIAAKEQSAMLNSASTKLLETVQGDTQKSIDRILHNIDTERRERINDGVRIVQTVSGQQSSSQNLVSNIENSAYATAINQIVSDRLTGRSTLDAQPVCIYSSPKPCDCPGCGCNG